MTDAIPAPAPAPEPSGAWFELSAQVGDISRSVQQLTRPRPPRPVPLRVPITRAGTVPASGVVALDFGAPSMGRRWSVRRLLVTDAYANTPTDGGGTPIAASGTFTAASAGNIPLPMGSSITGFDVTAAPAAATVTGLVTVTNTNMPPLNYKFTMTTTGGALSVQFPGPIGPSAGSPYPQVSLSAISGGSAYAITVYGITPAPITGAAHWYAGTPGLVTSTSEVWAMPRLPARERFSAENLTITPSDHLIAVITGATPGASILARADIIDYPAESGELTIPL